jgi:NADH-quinone oxidoreductase subunit E
MLSEEEKAEIEAEMAHFEQKRAACVEALKIVQRRRGWVSDETLRELAPILEMSPDELDNVATFYNLIFRHPVGKHVILICDSVSCWIMGYPRIREHIASRIGADLGGTSPDGMFTFLPIPCLGTCDTAPAMIVDETLYQNLDPQGVDRILEEVRGQTGNGAGS